MSGPHAVVGVPRPRLDAGRQTTGMLQFAGDVAMPGMLAGAFVRSTHAHARIVDIDTTAASALEGVHAVLVGTDLPTTYGILPVSQDETALAVDVVRYVGEPVAAVAAIDGETAARAAALITVTYEPLDEVVTIEDALTADLDRIHGDGRGDNVHRSASLEFGDVDAGMAVADHIRQDVFFYAGNTHAAIEPHAAVAFHDADGRLTLWSSTQVPHYVHRTLARVLDLSESRIRVVAMPVGGGFGGKTDPFSHEIAACALAMRSGRPVRFELSREEVFYAHRGRHPVLMWLATGFTEDGAITAMHLKTHLDGGAYGSYGIATLYYTGALQATTYDIPAYRFDGVRVFTNKPPCGPKRGHGTPQPRFALEAQLDKAADDLGIDPVEIRKRNLVRPHTTTVNHMRITSCGLDACIDKVVGASGFLDKRTRTPFGKGVGFAVGAYMSGAGLPIYWNDMPQSEVEVHVDRHGGVTVASMAADIGQGSTTMLAIVVAETLGLDPADLVVVTADTDLTPVDLGSYSSRVTFMAGNAALGAAAKARDRIAQRVAAHLEADPGDIEFGDGRVFVRGDPRSGVEWAEAARMAIAATGSITESGDYHAPDLAGPYRGAGVGISPAYSYSACVVEVDVDPDTGIVDVGHVWLAHDIGTALNPLLVEGQIEGGVVMGLGEALYEEHAFRGALHRGPSLLDYKIPTALEAPPITSIIVESDEREGPYGAKEVGQGPLLPVVPAVVNAIADAIDVRIDEVPVTPDKIMTALRNAARGRATRIGPHAVPAYDFGDPIRVEPPEGRA